MKISELVTPMISGLFVLGLSFFSISCGGEGSNKVIDNAVDTTVVVPAEMDSGDVDAPTGTLVETSIDITGAILESTMKSCADYVNSFTSSVIDANRNIEFEGVLDIKVEGDKCIFTSNAIPNHDFNDGLTTFVTNVSEQSVRYEITSNPLQSMVPTAITLGTDNAIFLNGVKLDLLAAACFGVADEKIGCFNMSQPWRFDPMSEFNDFGTDSHNAHTQPDGTYHYHGSPVALFYSDSPIVSPVIGFSADGFPIFGSYFDDSGSIRKALSSYQLKSGSRNAIDGINPGGSYDGTYRDDYEFVLGAGDLDECNGMTVNGSYAYYITESYPWVMACFKGDVDLSFNKQRP
ncbi:MAG: YHYH protein [Mariprofundaceae bacterium]